MDESIPPRDQWARLSVRVKLLAEINAARRAQRDNWSHYGPIIIAPTDPGLPMSPFDLPPDPLLDESAATAVDPKKLLFKMAADFPKVISASPQKDETPKHKIGIVGAGIAGLYIAMILDDLAIPDLTYEILEASPRTGGRVYTHKFTDTKHDYCDIGAMRFPELDTMKRTFDLFERVGFRKNEKLIPYYLKDELAVCPKMYNDRLFTPNESDPYHVGVDNKGSVPDYVVDDPGSLVEAEFKYYKDLMKKNFKEGFGELMKADDFSTREYLKRGGPDGKRPQYDFFSVQWMETQNTSSGLFDQAFTESVMDSFDFDDAKPWWCVDGGTSLVTDAMKAYIKGTVQVEKRVTAITLHRDQEIANNLSIKVLGEDKPRTGYSTVFSTTTLGALQRIDTTTLELHPSQKDAIRALHYDNSAKVALKFKEPWWINDCGIAKGATATTDLSIRTCVYPSYNIHDDLKQPAVLLATYTWAQDADRISSLIGTKAGEQQLIELILRDLARLHQKHISYEKIKDLYMEEYNAFSWGNDPWSSGAFALFGPGQFSNLYPYLVRPAAQSKFHIVGEASSTHHAWIVGALDSAYSAVYKFLRLYEMKEYMGKLKTNWGTVDELDGGVNGTAHLQVELGRLKEGQHIQV